MRTRLTQQFETLPESLLTHSSSLRWENTQGWIFLCPFYTPEPYLRQLHQYALQEDKRLLLLIPHVISNEGFHNIATYGCYRFKPRAIFSLGVFINAHSSIPSFAISRQSQ